MSRPMTVWTWGGGVPVAITKIERRRASWIAIRNRQVARLAVILIMLGF